MIVNLQRKIKLDTGTFAAFVDALGAGVAELENGDFAIAFVSDRRMKELNRFFRGKDSTTDVLSFPHEADEFVQSADFSQSGSDEVQAKALNEKFLGDIVISAEQAARQAEENGLTLENEIKQLILHGLLHLCGYDHETDDGEMNRRELELRKKLVI
jgi:probable rRNA maturation factor